MYCTSIVPIMTCGLCCCNTQNIISHFFVIYLFSRIFLQRYIFTHFLKTLFINEKIITKKTLFIHLFRARIRIWCIKFTLSDFHLNCIIFLHYTLYGKSRRNIEISVKIFLRGSTTLRVELTAGVGSKL